MRPAEGSDGSGVPLRQGMTAIEEDHAAWIKCQLCHPVVDLCNEGIGDGDEHPTDGPGVLEPQSAAASLAAEAVS